MIFTNLRRLLIAVKRENSRYAEQTAALLITLNLRHKALAAGIRFTGLDHRPPTEEP